MALRIEICCATGPASGRKICRSRANAQAAACVNAAAFRYPSVSVFKEPLPQAGGPWGHGLYVLSVTYRTRKFKMVLSTCCQKPCSRSFAAQCLGQRPAKSLAHLADEAFVAP